MARSQPIDRIINTGGIMRNTDPTKSLIDQLDPDNRLVFGYINKYLTEEDIYDQSEVEPLLTEIATHFVEAQKQGIKARDIIGNDPAKYCRDLGANLPHVRGGKARMIALAVAWSVITGLFLVEFLLDSNGHHQWWLSAAITALYPIPLVGFVAWQVHDTRPKSSSTLLQVALLLVIAIGLSLLAFWVFAFILPGSNSPSSLSAFVVNLFFAFVFWWSVRTYR